MLEKTSNTVANVSAERTRLKMMLSDMYSDKKELMKPEKRAERLLALPRSQQLIIVNDKELSTMKDLKGLTPVHDLGRYDFTIMLDHILAKPEIFDKPEYDSPVYGRPIDVAATHGDIFLKLELLRKLGREKLTAVRQVGKEQTTLLHELASQPHDKEVVAEILKLKDLLMTKTEDEGTVLSIIVNGGSKDAKRLAESLKKPG